MIEFIHIRIRKKKNKHHKQMLAQSLQILR